MILIVIHSIQKWLPFEKILDNGIIKLKNNFYVMILKVKPVNYNLKSNLEKEAILNSYKLFLKACDFDIQIIVKSHKQDLNSHISKIINNKNKESKVLQKISDKYLQEIEQIKSISKSDSKQFFILIKQSQQNNKEEICVDQLNKKYLKIKEGLLRCGNIVTNVNSYDETINILKKCIFFNNDESKKESDKY